MQTKTNDQLSERLRTQFHSVDDAVVRFLYDTVGIALPSGVLRFDLEKNQFTASLEVSRNPAQNIAHHGAYWYNLRLNLSTGAIFDGYLPRALADTGFDVAFADSHSPQYGFERKLAEYYARHGEESPFGKGVKVTCVRLIVQTRDYTSALGRWLKPEGIMTGLNRWLKWLGFAPLDTTQFNLLLSAVQAAHEASKYTAEWITEDRLISSVYQQEVSGRDFVSCMSGKPTDFFGLYDHLKSESRLSMVRLKAGDGEYRGRALVWFGENPHDTYLDRIYAPERNGMIAAEVLDALRSFCAANDIRKAVYQRTAELLGLQHIDRFSLRTNADPDDFTALPYVDSLRWWSTDNNKLRNYSGDGFDIEMDHTEGTADGFEGSMEGRTLLANGDVVDEDDAVYIDRRGEYYHIDECVQTYDDCWEHADECIELYNGDFAHRRDTSIVMLYDGEYAHEDDTVCTYDNRCMLTDDATELYDGEYAATFDDDLVKLHDGRYAIRDRDELVELTTGEWAFADDPNIVEDDNGSFSLRAEAEAEAEVDTAAA
jgi:hypothetical protein